MYNEDQNFNTAREFFDALLGENVFEAKSVLDVSEKITSGYIFRGQANKNWSLLPSAHRSDTALNNHTPQPASINHAKDSVEYVSNQTHAELRSVLLFLEAADHIGIQTPIDYNLFKGFVTELDSSIPAELLPIIGFAQHYGVPTRLLDWTESPFIAAYFAAKGALRQQGEELFSIYCVNVNMLKNLASIDIVSAPKAHNRHLGAQRGLFTIINSANNFYLQHNKWPSLEDIYSLERPETYYMKRELIRLSLPSKEAPALLKLLYKLDISELTIMPSLQNAANNFAYKKYLWGKG